MNNIEQFADAIDQTSSVKKRITDMRSKHLTAQEMADSLNKQGIRTTHGKSWSKEKIRKFYLRHSLNGKKMAHPNQRVLLNYQKIHFGSALLCNPLCISMLALLMAIVALIRSL